MSEIRKVETNMELLDKVLSKENLNKAYKQVYKNKGASGVDGVTVEELFAYIKEHISPEASFEYYDTICRQVANRMPNIQTFAANHDLILFVCGRKSSNGKILFHECKKVNPNTFLIDQPEEIDLKMLEGATSIGICGATSTPKWLMEECKKVILMGK